MPPKLRNKRSRTSSSSSSSADHSNNKENNPTDIFATLITHLSSLPSFYSSSSSSSSSSSPSKTSPQPQIPAKVMHPSLAIINRTIQTKPDCSIPINTITLSIPLHHILTCDNDIKEKIVKLDAQQTILPPPPYNINSITPFTNPMSISDVALAIKFCNQLTNPVSTFKPYFDTLPSFASCKVSIPACWNNETLNHFFPNANSFIRRRIAHHQSQLKQIHSSLVKPLDKTIAFDAFMYAYCVISSRSFSVDGVEGLIPLMDMSNHKRPRDTSYSLVNNSIVVTTLRSIGKGEEVCITYGAKGNRELLLSYGFCMVLNVEPDGSSNDEVSVEMKDSAQDKKDDDDDDIDIDTDGTPKYCNFRLGDVSYTYGCLNKAADFFRSKSRTFDFVKSKADNDNDNDDDVGHDYGFDLDKEEDEEEDEDSSRDSDDDEVAYFNRDEDDEDAGFDDIEGEEGRVCTTDITEELNAFTKLGVCLKGEIDALNCSLEDLVNKILSTSSSSSSSNVDDEWSNTTKNIAILTLLNYLTLTFYNNAVSTITSVLTNLGDDVCVNTTKECVDFNLDVFHSENPACAAVRSSTTKSSATAKNKKYVSTSFQEETDKVLNMINAALDIDKLVKVYTQIKNLVKVYHSKLDDNVDDGGGDSEAVKGGVK